MEFIRGWHNLRERHRGCVATIGNFDGVHLGHQAVLGQLAEQSEAYRLPSMVITFEPHPKEFFRPESAPPRLTRLRDKLTALRRFSVDRVLCLRFDRRLADMPPERFVQDLLVDTLGVRYLAVGDDFRFGRDRAGDFATLQRMGRTAGFQVARMRTFCVGDERVSSTRIRQALAEGDLAMAEQLLGRPYRICGHVVHGHRRGRTIGFPTANLYLHRRTAPPIEGVFCVDVYGVGDGPWPGVANVGTRPTVDGRRTLLEVFLFDFEGDLYGRHLRVDFLRRLRPERRFESLEALREQIARDTEAAQAFFAARR